VTRQREDLDRDSRAEAEDLTAAQLQVDGDVWAHRIPQPGERLLGIADPVVLVPAVALAHDQLAVFDPRHVRRVRAEDSTRRRLADSRVAAEMIDVGVAEQDEVRLDPCERGQDHIRGRLLHAGVDEE
jgi:hypothetical protein